MTPACTMGRERRVYLAISPDFKVILQLNLSGREGYSERILRDAHGVEFPYFIDAADVHHI